MPHKDKICTPALATHIEDCDEMFSFAPLVIEQSWEYGDVAGKAVGLREIRARETDAIFQPKIQKALRDIPDDANMVANFLKGHAAGIAELELSSPGISREISASLSSVLKEGVRVAEAARIEEVMTTDACCIEESEKGPEARLEERLAVIGKDFDVTKLMGQAFLPYNRVTSYEMNSLGVFFTESLCFSCNGKTYDACGDEFTLLPGDAIVEKTSWSTSTDDTSTQTDSSSSDSTTTNTLTTSTDFTTVYHDEKSKKTNIKTSAGLTLKGGGKVFKFLNLSGDLKASASSDFTKYMKSTHDSTIKDKKELVRKVVTTLKSSTSLKQVRKRKTSDSYSYARNLKNTTESPIHYIEREGYCVYTVYHRRTNAHLAWSACLDNPGQGLCTPETFEEDHAEEIAAIVEKWSLAAAPGSLGPRPANVDICTESFQDEKWGNGTQGYTEFTPSVQIAVPPGHSYVGGSAHVNMLSYNSELHEHNVTSQPVNGATGNGTLKAKILVTNRRPFKREIVAYQFCYTVAPDEAKAWDARLEAWQLEQANVEIEALRAAEAEKFGEFLLSDRARELLVRKLLQKYFAIDDVTDCCHLIARLERIFDFSRLSYRLYPSWNERGDGCQKSESVNIGNALCAHLFTPVHEGMELEALKMLAAVNALDMWSPSVAAQIAGYINEIEQLRATVFKPAFEVTDALIAQIDSPQGAPMTPYDTASDVWASELERPPGYILLDAYTVTVPCGSRTEIKPNLCG